MILRKKHPRIHHERWLVSYADFITLLFAFFVVLFASAQADKKKQAAMAGAIAHAFGQKVILNEHAQPTPLPATPATPIALPATQPQKPDPMGIVKTRLTAAAAREIADGAVEIHQDEGGLTISLQDARFFNSGSAAVRAQALPTLERIASVLPETALRVEGHTDNVPIRTPQFASNWELSSARASSIARLLLRYPNVHAERLSVAGYAEFHPVADNSTPEGRARNRRVDIVVQANP